MRTALLVLLLLAGAVALAFWLADLGGSVEIRVGDAVVALPLALAALGLALTFLVLHAVLALFGTLRRWPARRRAARALRRRDEGDGAVTRALVALAAGTPEQARLEIRRARSTLGDTPTTLLLTAEAERMAGHDGQAEEVFRALAARPEARFLGLRGLLRAAMERGDWDQALVLARDAEAAQPGAAWLREERQQLALRTRNWREALALAPPDAPRSGLALAAAGQETDAARAGDLERQAWEADRTFAPAALAHAARLRAAGHPRRARSVLEEAWAARPHPELATAYLAEEPDPLMRVKLAEALVRRNPTVAESRVLMARLSLDGGLTGRARTELEPLARAGGADRRAYLLLAELEIVEAGETAEARAAEARWLREAARAPAEPVWQCAQCGTVHPAWAPVCDACGTAGRIGWTQPAPGSAKREVVPAG